MIWLTLYLYFGGMVLTWYLVALGVGEKTFGQFHPRVWFLMAVWPLLGWLCYHWLFARNGQHDSWLDVIFASMGVLLALAAYYVQNGRL